MAASNNYSSLNVFKSQFTSVRPNRFKVDFPMKWSSNMIKNNYISESQVPDCYRFCCAATLPSSEIDFIEVPYMGRMFRDSGDRRYRELVLTYYNTQDFAIRNFYEDWMNNISQYNEIYQIAGTVSKNTYDIFMDELTVTQLDRRNFPLKIYSFYGVFPSQCSDIKLDFSSLDSIELFDVTLQYQWWESKPLPKPPPPVILT